MMSRIRYHTLSCIRVLPCSRTPLLLLSSSSALRSLHHCARSLFSDSKQNTNSSTAATSSPPSSSPSSRPSSSPLPPDTSRLYPSVSSNTLLFGRWLSSHGVRFQQPRQEKPILAIRRVASAPDEWYLACVTPTGLSSGTTLFRLPLSLTLSPSSPWRDPGIQSISMQQKEWEDAATAALQHLFSRIPLSHRPARSALRLLVEYGHMLAKADREERRRKGETVEEKEMKGRPEDSFFSPYLRLLPHSYPTLPLFWSRQEVEELQYEPVVTNVMERKVFIQRWSKEMRKVGSQENQSALALFGSSQLVESLTDPGRLAWAYSSVTSRAFNLNEGGEKQGMESFTSLPLADMCNHSFTPNCKITLEPSVPGEAQCLRLETIKEIKNGEALTMSYGNLSNDILLTYYGFISDSNTHDTLLLSRSLDSLELAADMMGITLPEKSPLTKPEKEWRGNKIREIMEKRDREDSTSSSYFSSPSSHFTVTRYSLDPTLLSLARLMLAKDEKEFDTVTDSKTPATTVETDQDLSYLSRDVLHVLHGLLSLLLSKGFETSIEKDIELLNQVAEEIMTPADSSTPLSENELLQKQTRIIRKELAIRYRIGKKRILQEQLQKLQREIQKKQ